MTEHEAACVTGVPPGKVCLIIDSGLLAEAAKNLHGTRSVSEHALVALKFAHEAMPSLSMEARRRLVRQVPDDPRIDFARSENIAIGMHPIRDGLQRGIAAPESAKKEAKIDPCIVHQRHEDTGSRHRRNPIKWRFGGGDSSGVPQPGRKAGDRRPNLR